MNRRTLLRRLLWSAPAMGSLSLGGCGSLLHSERIHRHHSRDIDWKIVALNGLGLAFFFVPGVIAFVIDFYTGAIYLPPRGHAMNDHRGGTKIPHPPQVAAAADMASDRTKQASWETVVLPPENLSPEVIEEVVSERVGEPVPLLNSEARVSPLSGREDWSKNLRAHVADSRFGCTVRRFFEPAMGV